MKLFLNNSDHHIFFYVILYTQVFYIYTLKLGQKGSDFEMEYS